MAPRNAPTSQRDPVSRFRSWTGITSDGTVAVSQSVAISSGSGTVGVRIGGVLVTVTWGTSDAATATALVAAINAKAELREVAIAVTTGAGTFVIKSAYPTASLNDLALLPVGTGVTIGGGTTETLLSDDTVGVDPTELPFLPRGLHVSTAGTITFIGVNDKLTSIATVVAGAVYPYRPKVILTTGTTATGLILGD